MININVSKLNDVISDYSVLVDRIKKNNDNIIGNFYLMKKNWNDNRINAMSSNFNKEKVKYVGLQEDIVSQLYIYRFISSKYGELGNKVKCNLDGKGLIYYKLDNIISQLNTVMWQFNNLGDISFYPNSAIIFEYRDDLKNIIDSFSNIRDRIKSKFDYVSSIESTVSEKLRDLKIENIVLNKYESEE